MTVNAITVVFLIALAVSYAIEYWLARRHLAHVSAHRDAVPEAFSTVMPLEAHQKAADYTIDKGRLGEKERLIGALFLLTLTLGGGLELLIQFWGQFDWSAVVSGTVVILSTLIITQIVELPLGIYQTFVIEQRHGFNRNTPAQFARDFALQLLLMLVIGSPIIAALIWVMESLGSSWWIWAWAILMSFSILMSWAFPTFIAPLFNKFTPLPDPGLRERIERLLQRCGFSSNGIFVMDGSRRSGHGNAYFTGIGNNKRIVFFDTLVEALEHEELEAVLAHELGHFKCKHVIKMLIASAVMTLIGFAILGWLAQHAWFYQGLGVAQPSSAAALLLFMLITPVFTVFLQPVMAYFQRKHEFEADRFASTHAKASALTSALVKLYRDNAGTLTPDPLYAAFHYSHPPAAIRIAHLEQQTG